MMCFPPAPGHQRGTLRGRGRSRVLRPPGHQRRPHVGLQRDIPPLLVHAPLRRGERLLQHRLRRLTNTVPRR